VANKIWYIEDYELKEYPGTYDEYMYWKEQKSKNDKEGKKTELPVKKAEQVPAAKSIKTDDSGKLIKSAQVKLERIEEKIGALETRKKELEKELAKPDLYKNNASAVEINQSYESLKAELVREQNTWEVLALEIEILEKK
jgi:ATP-binding cassette subfamily F protein 3